MGLLSIGAIVALVICYQLSISRTMELYRNYSSLEEVSLNDTGLMERLQLLTLKSKILDSIGLLDSRTNGDIDKRIFDIIQADSLKRKIGVSQFERSTFMDEGDKQREFYRFHMEIDFLTLVRTLYDLETDLNWGQVTHLRFAEQESSKQKGGSFECLVILQEF